MQRHAAFRSRTCHSAYSAPPIGRHASVLTQSLAEYLEEAHPEPALLPGDAIESLVNVER
jgi:hypothetical protein